MEWFSKSKEEVLADLNSKETGLTKEQAEQNLTKYGKNEITAKKRTSMLKIFLSQFKNLMIIVLIVAAVVSLLLNEVADSVIIFIVVLLNAVLGTVQESKAEAAIEALSEMSAPYAKVLRNGDVEVIPAKEVTVGDVVLLEAGDNVPCDMRLLKSAGLKIEEATLTGESVPTEKDAQVILQEKAPIADRINMAFAGTNVTYGTATGVATEIGMQTQMGSIAKALESAKNEETPLQRKMTQLSKILTYAVLAIAVVVFFVGVAQGKEYFEMFLFAVSLAVAAIPEGLATVVTIVLTMGVTRLAKQGAIIRKLPAVETLGSTQIICSDKTGTLTQNKMQVVKLFYDMEEKEADTKFSDTAKELIFALSVCNDAKSSKDGLIGDPTETALIELSYKFYGKEDTDSIFNYQRLIEKPFDSDRKMMSLSTMVDNKAVIYTKGAPDVVISNCKYALINGEIKEMTADLQNQIMQTNEGMAKQALRVLGAAKEVFDTPPPMEEFENGMIFLGLVGMIDPPRPEVKAAVEVCKGAGMRAVMITGDHKTTASAIATQLGILQEDDLAITGADLDEMSENELKEKINHISVYARVSPENKVRIVDTFKSLGKIVAMTGDGVNDAPALKRSDIGVGMGITGTQVSKGAADMILTDDNFATIVNAVGEGRRIYANIKRTVQFLLSANLSEVIALFFGMLLGYTVLSPAQILWINLVTDTFPALALGMEAPEANNMSVPPRDPRKSFFADGMGVFLIIYGVTLGLVTLAVYVWSYSHEGPQRANTMAFLVMGISQLFYMFNVRSQYTTMFAGLKKNLWMYAAFAVSLGLQLMVVLVPQIASFFELEAINAFEWGIVFLACIVIIPVCEITKAIARGVIKAKNK